MSQMFNFTHSDHILYSLRSNVDVSCVLFKATIIAIFQERWYISVRFNPWILHQPCTLSLYISRLLHQPGIMSKQQWICWTVQQSITLSLYPRIIQVPIKDRVLYAGYQTTWNLKYIESRQYWCSIKGSYYLFSLLVLLLSSAYNF